MKRIGLVAAVMALGAVALASACSSSDSGGDNGGAGAGGAGGSGGSSGSAGSAGVGGSAGDDSGTGGSAGDDSGTGGSAGDDSGAAGSGGDDSGAAGSGGDDSGAPDGDAAVSVLCDNVVCDAPAIADTDKTSSTYANVAAGGTLETGKYWRTEYDYYASYAVHSRQATLYIDTTAGTAVMTQINDGDPQDTRGGTYTIVGNQIQIMFDCPTPAGPMPIDYTYSNGTLTTYQDLVHRIETWVKQ